MTKITPILITYFIAFYSGFKSDNVYMVFMGLGFIVGVWVLGKMIKVLV